MTILKNHNRWDKSNVEFSAGVLIEYSKQSPRPEMHYIDYGLGILSADVFKGYPPNQSFDLSKVYNHLSLEGELHGYEVFQRFYEIGSQQGILEAEEYIKAKGLK